MQKNHQYPQDLIAPVEAARLLGLTVSGLQMRRAVGLSPRYYKFGKPGSHSQVRYSRRDVLDYLNRCLREPKDVTREAGRGRN